MINDKSKVRSQMKEVLHSLHQSQYTALSETVCRNLIHTEEWKRSTTIGITMSRFPEVDTHPIIQKGWDEGKNMAIPKSESHTRTMEFYLISSFDQVARGYHNIMEPIVDECVPLLSQQIDLLVVPGMAFNRSGYRLGYGGGFYDRYLATFQQSTLALAFAMQIIDTIPLQHFDLPVQKIVTEKEVIDCTGQDWQV